MRRHLKQRFWAKDGDPGPTAWTIAVASVVLPIAGGLLLLIGGARAFEGGDGAVLMMGIGAGFIVADIAIDLVWAHPGVTESDQPNMNKRGAQLTGRIVEVAEPIEHGRGKVRIGDSVWPAEGADAARGVLVRVVAADGQVLRVEPLESEPRISAPGGPTP